MSEPILDHDYWAKRLNAAMRDKENLHHAVFKCSAAQWHRITKKHTAILARHIKSTDSILDCGCGWGRLFDMLPEEWHGRYVGVDRSPCFIDMAEAWHNPDRRDVAAPEFRTADIRDLREFSEGEFDWAVLISIRPMVKRNLGESEWLRMEGEIRRVCRQILYLEYDPDDEGSVE